jgi:hypothetical protein
MVRAIVEDRPTLVPPTTRAVLATFDWRLLSLEQEARRRNLTKQVVRGLPSLETVLAPEMLAELMDGFVNSQEFWMPRGRTIQENFCLFAAEQMDADHRFERDVLRLCGIVTGLIAAPAMPSPWPPQMEQEQAPTVDGALAVETFVSDWRLLGPAGSLPDGTNLNEVRERVRSSIIVSVFPGPTAYAVSLPLEEAA